MFRRPLAMAGLALLALAGLSLGRAATAQEAQKAEAPAACVDCHEQAKAFTQNPHQRAAGKAVRGTDAACAVCHGDATKHLESAGEQPVEKVLRGREGAETCLTCHEKSAKLPTLRTGAHASSDTVNCLTCHSIHSADRRSPKLLAKPQLALCAGCHPAEVASHRDKPYAHRLGRGVMECSSCHDPHSEPGRENLKVTRTGELPCLSCHTEKRGPFVYEHGGIAVGDCLTCHQPHGSSNPKRLTRATIEGLCHECHTPLTPGTYGSQPPSTHDTFVARWRNCTTCHVAIHGSNRDPKLLK